MIKKIAIFGSQGELGRFFIENFKKKNYRLIEIDKNNSVTNWQKKIRSAEIVIVSVPINKTPAVIRQLKNTLSSNQILVDFTSVKKFVIPEILKTKAILISAHPMFGRVKQMAGQKIILLPVRAANSLVIVEQLFQSIGLKTQVMQDWENHDSYMSVIQGLLHFSQLTFVKTLRKQNLNLETLLSICSPIYKIMFSIACRIISRNPDLYMHILMDNPNNQKLLEDFVKNAKTQLKIIKEKKEQEFLADFDDSNSFLKSQLTELGELSEFLIQQTQKQN